MSKLTEGPWVAKRQPDTFSRHMVKCGSQFICQYASEADATAIASLPDLVEAAKPMVGLLEAWEAADRPWGYHDDLVIAQRDSCQITLGQLRALRSVLNKIKGGA